MKPVNNKRDFVRRYRAGEFGNKMPTWNNLKEALPHINPDLLYHLRNKVAGGRTFYNVSGLVLEEVATSLKGDFYVTEMCNHWYNVIQGEVLELPPELGSKLYVVYSRAVGVPMRTALELEQIKEYGLNAMHLLQRTLNFKSYEWLRYLLDAYPNHVVEITVLNRHCGEIPGHNTLFWEVRNY